MAGVEVIPERDVKDFKFQQMCRVRIFDSPETSPYHGSQLVASSSLYGFTFLGTTKGFKVIRTSDLSEVDEEHALKRTTKIIEDFPIWTHIELPGSSSFLSLNCDNSMLAVEVTIDSSTFCYVYDVRGFGDQGRVFEPFHKIKLKASVLDLAWNPVQPSMIVVCTADGSLDLFDIGGSLKIVATMNSDVQGRALCWSPKGKQLVLGTGRGTMIQFDQDLKQKKEWPCPHTLPTDSQYEVVGLIWISTYMFMASYMPVSAPDTEQPFVIITAGSKDALPNFISFEDPCYGNGDHREKKFLFKYIQNWEMILANSSTACETAVIAKHFDHKETFERWNLDDSSRAELPLTTDYRDTFPMGMAIDFSSQFRIPTGENTTHPPSPILILMSTDGVIVPYYMMYSHSEAGDLTRPLQPLTSAGARTSQRTTQSDAVTVPRTETTSFLSQRVTGPSFQFATQPTAASSGPSVFGSGAMTFSFSSSGSNTSTTSRSLFGSLPVTTTASSSSVTKSLFSFPKAATASQSESSSISSASTTPSGQTTGGPSSAGSGSVGLSSTASSNFSFTGNQVSSSMPGSNLFGKMPAEVKNLTHFGITPTEGNNPPPSNLFGKTPAEVNSPASSSNIQKTFSGIGTTQTTQASSVGTGFSTGVSKFSFSGNAPASLGGMGFGGTTTTGTTTTTAGISAIGTTAPSAGFNFSLTPVATATRAAPPISAPEKTVGSTSGSLPKPQGAASALGRPLTESTPAVQGFGTLKAAMGTPTLPAGANSAPPTFTGLGQPPKSTLAATTGGMAPTGIPGGVKPIPQLSSTPQTTVVAKSPVPTAASTAYNISQSSTRAGQTFPVPATANQKEDTGEDDYTGGNSLDNTFAASIREEMAHFEKELREFKSRASASPEVVDSRDKLQSLKKQTEEMSKFCDEVKVNTKEQSKEITDQKTLCLDLFAMVEECRINKQRKMDPKYKHLLRTRALDPRSHETLRSLQQQHQLLDQGLRDVDAILDQQWEEFQAKRKNKNRIQAPRTDGLYRAMKSNRNLIIGQKCQLGELEEKLKQLRLYNRTSSWQQPSNSVTRDSELSTLADSLLETTSQDRSTMSSKSLTTSPQKQAKLRDFLTRRIVPKVKSTRPENLSMSKIVSAEKLRQMLGDTESDISSDGQSAPGIQYRGPQLVNSSGRPISIAKKKTGVRKPPQDPPLPQVTHQVSQKPAFLGLGKQGVTSLGHITVEDITPPSSTGYREDDDDDDDDDDDYGEGFGPGYDMQGDSTESEVEARTLQRKKAERKTETFSSTPLTAFKPSEPQLGSFSPGINRNLFGGSSSTSYPTGPQLAASALPKTTVAPPVRTSASVAEDAGVKTSTDKGSSGTSYGAGFNFTGTKTTAPGFAFGSTSISSGFSFSGSSKLGQPLMPPAMTTTAAGISKTGQPQTSSIATTSSAGSSKLGAPVMSSAVTSSSTAADTQATNPLLARALSDSGDDETLPLPALTAKEQNDVKPIKLSAEKQENPVVVSSSEQSVTSSQPITAGVKGQPSSIFTTPSTLSSLSAPGAGIFGTKPSGSGTISFGSTAGHPSLAGFTNAGPQSIFGQSAAAPGVTKESSKAPVVVDSTRSAVSDKAQASDSGVAANAATTEATTRSVAPTTATTASSTTGLFGQTTSTVGTTSTNFSLPAALTSTAATTADSATTKPTVQNSLLFSMLNSTEADTTTAAGMLGQQSTTATASAGSLFGTSTSTTASTTAGLFGQSTTAGTSSVGSVFGQPNTTSSATGSSIFGTPASSTASTTSAATSLFGQPTSSATATTAGPFGQQTTQGLFGQAGGSFGTSSSSGLGSSPFGQTGKTFTTPSSSTASTEESKGMFDQPKPPFGSSATTTAPLFGGTATATTAAPLFGGTATATTSAPLFGSTANASTTAPLFGGTTTATTSAPLFGSTANASTTAPLFGGSATSSTGGSVFGFGQTTTSTSAGFGQSATTSPAPMFGGLNKPAGFGQSSFGQPGSGSSGFGQTTSSSFASGSSFGGGGGGLFTGLGGKPSAEKASTNVFGTPQSFASSSNSSNTLFGSQGASTFGSVGNTGSPGAFSGGFSQSTGGSVASSGFGVGKSPTAGFGGTAAFGGTPSFGGSPGFGSPASTSQFGGSPTFGGGAGFGSGASFPNTLGGGTFGSPSPDTGSVGFASFAQSNSPSFGALASSPDAPTFGGLSQTSTGFGSSPAGFGGNQGFGNTAGSNPAFSGYRS